MTRNCVTKCHSREGRRIRSNFLYLLIEHVALVVNFEEAVLGELIMNTFNSLHYRGHNSKIQNSELLQMNAFENMSTR